MSIPGTEAVPELGAGFRSGTARVNGTTIHYVRGGHGPTLVLLHGFPQDWFEWRRIMPRLSRRFTVVAADLRGVGGSAPTEAGYAAADLATDMRLLIDELGLGPAHVVGHDIGGWVAYAFARRFPDSARTVTILETPVPGIEPWLNLDVDVPLWHGAFHMVPGLPEALVADRQEIYFRYFFETGTVDSGVISDADLKHYADAYGDPARLRSAFEIYRALPSTMAYNAGQTSPIRTPLLLAGGEHVFGPVLPRLADNLRAHYGWADVTVEIVSGGRHYLPEERPDDIAGHIEQHAAGRAALSVSGQEVRDRLGDRFGELVEEAVPARLRGPTAEGPVDGGGHNDDLGRSGRGYGNVRRIPASSASRASSSA